MKPLASLLERPPPAPASRVRDPLGVMVQTRGGYIGAVTRTGVRFRGVSVTYVKIKNKFSKMCNKINCAIQYTVDLINNNINRDVQEECANRLYRVYIHSSNADDVE